MQVDVNKLLQSKHLKRRLSFTLFAIIALAICLKLGFWQLARAEQKRQLLNTPQTIITTLEGITPTNVHQPIKLTGTFDNQHPILLDNQVQNKQAGYHFYLPFISQNNTILVNLGWIPSPAQRSQLPELIHFTEQYAISGTLSFAQGSPLLLGDNAVMTEQGILRVQKTVISDIQTHLPYPIAPLLLQLDSDNKIGFNNNWTIAVMPPEKHLAYAAQWFALAAAIFVISLFWLRAKL